MDGVELVPVLGEELERVGLVEGEGEARLRVKVNAGHVEAGPVVPDRTAARPAEQIKQTGPRQ